MTRSTLLAAMVAVLGCSPTSPLDESDFELPNDLVADYEALYAKQTDRILEAVVRGAGRRVEIHGQPYRVLCQPVHDDLLAFDLFDVFGSPDDRIITGVRVVRSFRFERILAADPPGGAACGTSEGSIALIGADLAPDDAMNLLRRLDCRSMKAGGRRDEVVAEIVHGESSIGIDAGC